MHIGRQAVRHAYPRWLPRLEPGELAFVFPYPPAYRPRRGLPRVAENRSASAISGVPSIGTVARSVIADRWNIAARQPARNYAPGRALRWPQPPHRGR
jgi:hypothetical protein